MQGPGLTEPSDPRQAGWQVSTLCGHPPPPLPRHAGCCDGPGSLALPGGHSLGNKIFVFSAGRPSRLPDCGGRDAEPPGNKLPLLISFSQGDLDTVRTEDRPLSYQQASSGRGPAGRPRQPSGGHTQRSAEERGAGLRRPPVTGPKWGWGSAVEAQGRAEGLAPDCGQARVCAWAEGTSTREWWWGNAGAGSPRGS